MLQTLMQLPTGEDDEHKFKRVLDEEKVKDFVGDFYRYFEDLAKGIKKMLRKLKLVENIFGKVS